MHNRVTHETHDVFTPQTWADTDVYLLRMILHDWADEKPLVILRYSVLTLKAGPLVRCRKTSSSLLSRRLFSSYRPRYLSPLQVLYTSSIVKSSAVDWLNFFGKLKWW